MIITKRRIQYQRGGSIKLKVLSDIHMGNTHCDVRAFKQYIDDPEAYFIGIGDYADAILPGDPRYARSSDSGEVEAKIDEQVELFSGLLKGISKEGRLLGLGSGNHERQILKRHGTDMVGRMSKELNVPYLGYSGLYNLTLVRGTKDSRSVIIRYHHGFGGGARTQGADLTKFSRECSYWDADLFLYGHVHRLQADKVPRLGLAGSTLVARPQQLCICGTFLKTFGTGPEPSYSEEKGYPPIETGGLSIRLTPKPRGFKMKVSL